MKAFFSLILNIFNGILPLIAKFLKNGAFLKIIWSVIKNYKKLPFFIKLSKLLIKLKLRGDKVDIKDFLPILLSIVKMIREYANKQVELTAAQKKIVTVGYVIGKEYGEGWVKETDTDLDDNMLQEVFVFAETEIPELAEWYK